MGLQPCVWSGPKKNLDGTFLDQLYQDPCSTPRLVQGKPSMHQYWQELNIPWHVKICLEDVDGIRQISLNPRLRTRSKPILHKVELPSAFLSKNRKLKLPHCNCLTLSGYSFSNLCRNAFHNVSHTLRLCKFLQNQPPTHQLSNTQFTHTCAHSRQSNISRQFKSAQSNLVSESAANPNANICLSSSISLVSWVSPKRLPSNPPL